MAAFKFCPVWREQSANHLESRNVNWEFKMPLFGHQKLFAILRKVFWKYDLYPGMPLLTTQINKEMVCTFRKAICLLYCLEWWQHSDVPSYRLAWDRQLAPAVYLQRGELCVLTANFQVSASYSSYYMCQKFAADSECFLPLW